MSKAKAPKKFRPGVHGAQAAAIQQAAQSQPFQLHELGNTYAGAKDRFIVSLIVSYREPYIKTAQAAGAAALALTTDDGSPDTHWFVFDRKTGQMHQFEQSDLENLDEEIL